MQVLNQLIIDIYTIKTKSGVEYIAMKLKNIIAKNKGVFSIVVFFTAINAVGETVSAMLLASGVNEIIQKDFHLFLWYLSLAMGAWLVALISSYISAFIRQNFIQNISLQLRDSALSEAYVSVENSEGQIKKSNFINMATTDILTIETGISGIFLITGSIISAISAAIALLYYSYWLLLAIIFFTLIFILIPVFFQKKLVAVTQNVSKENERITKDTTNLISGIFDLFNYQALSLIRKKNSDNSLQMKNVKLNYTKVTNLLTITIAGTTILSQVSLIGLAGYLAYLGIFGFGLIVSVGNLANQFFSAISELSETNTVIVGARAILSKFSLQKKINTESNHPINFSQEISTENLKYNYKDKQVTFPNMTFQKNKKYLINGESGSGKTTFINLLSGSLKNYEGSLTIDQQEYKEISKVDLLNSIAVMSQHSFILNGTIKENICLTKPFDPKLFSKVLSDSCLDNLINELQLGENTQIDSDDLKLSGGQIQRIAIARAFYHNKNILIFDEGTANLDAKTAKSIEQTLLTNPDKTAIIISHSFSQELTYLLDNTYTFC